MKLSDPKYDVFDIRIDSIYADPGFNCRGRFSLESIEELAKSIQTEDLLFPVVVQPAQDAPEVPKKFEYRLLCGFRRLTACKEILGWETIPGNVRSGLTEHEAKVLNLQENLERKDLNILEEATAINKLFPSSRTTSSIAKELNKSMVWVRVRRALPAMSKRIQTAAASGALTGHDLRTIIASDDPDHTARQMINAAKKGKKYSIFHRRGGKRNKTEVQAKIAELLKEGLHPNILRLMGWCISEVTDEQFEEAVAWLKEKKGNLL